jgi:hypothetical protein
VRNTSKERAIASEGITWNDAAFPVVRIVVRDGKDERLIWLLQQFDGLFARCQPYVALCDTTPLSTIPSASTRHLIGKWQTQHEADLKKWCLGVAFLVPSRLVRGALTAMGWVHRPVTQQYFPSTRREALDWCIATADAGGLALSSIARGMLQSPDG